MPAAGLPRVRGPHAAEPVALPAGSPGAIVRPVSAVIDALDREVRGFARRLREAPMHWFAAAAPPFATREDAAFHVVRRIASAAVACECPDRAMPSVPRVPALAMADQLDVVSHDLFAVVDGHDGLAGQLLAELLLHRWHIDGSPPGPSSSVLAAEATGEEDLVGWQRLCARNEPV